MNRYSVIFYVFLLFLGPIVKAQTPRLWGMTRNGGNFNNSQIGDGVIFKINEDGSGFDTTHAFDSIAGEYPNGNLIVASDGKLYGMTSKGGDSSRNDGVIFSIDPSTNKFTKLFHFENFNGAEPFGSLVEYNGILYGMTYSGGKYTDGVIFSFDPTDGAYTDLHDFDLTSGAEPYFGNLILASNNIFYGMTSEGGTSTFAAGGVIFSFDPANNNKYTVLYNFNNMNGASPYGSLLQATNGKLYGTCHSTASTGGSGTIFSFDPVGGTYKDEYNFPFEPAADPYGSFIQVGDSMLYGMTFGGGEYSAGNIFRFNIYNDSVIDVYDFNGINDDLSYGSLLLAANNKLYGMTSEGGYGFGNIFSFNLDSNTCDDIHDFNDSTGLDPLGSLIEITTTSGIKQVASSNYKVSIFPNPAFDQVSIRANEVINKIEITTILGQTILEKTFGTGVMQQTLDVSLIPSGLYFITVSSNNQITTKKIVVSR